MRGGKGLVEVDVHGIDAEVTRPHDTHDGVEVGTIAVKERAGGVDGGHYLLDAFGATSALDYNFNGSASQGGRLR